MQIWWKVKNLKTLALDVKKKVIWGFRHHWVNSFHCVHCFAKYDFVWSTLPTTLCRSGTLISFILVCRGLSGLDWLGGRLAGLLLAVFLGAVVGGPVQDALWGLQCLKVLPGAQQGRIVDQCVQQLPARANPPTASCLARLTLLNSWKHGGARCQGRTRH